MNGGRSPASGADAARDLRARLETVERLLDARDQAPVDAPHADASPLPTAMAALEQAASRTPEEAGRLAGRLRAVRARHALRARQVPAGVLDGLYEAIRAETVDAPRADVARQRARMSRAFLDAPRSLVVWRRAALAACALLALGAGWLTATGPRGDGPSPAARPAEAPLAQHDARDDLLRRLEPQAPVAGGNLVNPVGWPGPQERGSRAPMVFTGRDPDVRRFLDAIRRPPFPAAAKDRDLEQN